MKREIKVHIDTDFVFWPCLTILVIFTWGEPSLLNAMIHALMAVGA